MGCGAPDHVFISLVAFALEPGWADSFLNGRIRLDSGSLEVAGQRLDGRLHDQAYEVVGDVIREHPDQLETPIRRILGNFIDDSKLQWVDTESTGFGFSCASILLDRWGYDVWAKLFPTATDMRLHVHVSSGDGSDYLLCSPKNLGSLQRDLEDLRQTMLFAAKHCEEENWTCHAEDLLPLIQFSEEENVACFYELHVG